jgi:hypothetical protein
MWNLEGEKGHERKKKTVREVERKKGRGKGDKKG